MALRSQHDTREYADMRELRRDFVVRDPAAVEDYVTRHPGVLTLLPRAAAELRDTFPPDSLLVLDVPPDYEGEGERDLFVRIQTKIDVDDAIERLARFDEGWWRHASVEAPRSLHFTTDYV